MKISSFGACLLLVGSVACRRTSDEAEKTAAVAAPTVVERLVWSAGQRASYDLGYVTLSKAGETPVPLFIGLHAHVELSFEAVDRKLLASVSLSDVRFVDQAGNPLVGAEKMVRELSQPFGLEFEQGRLTAYFDPEGPHLSTTGYRQSLAALLQLPLGAAPARLSTTEWDASGLARVEYQRRADGAWDWKKLDYQSVLINRQSGAPTVTTKDLKPEVLRSSGRVQLGPSGIDDLSRHEELSVRLNANQTLTADTDVTLKRVDARPSQVDAPSVFDAARRRAVDVPIGPTQAASWDEVMIGGRSFSQVLTELGSSVTAPSGQTRANLFQALVALLRSEPSNVRDAERSIRAASPLAETLLDALAMASTPESLRALSVLSVDPQWSLPRRKRAASSLIRARRPDAAALDSVMGLAEVTGLREHALLGVGTYVRLFREQGEPRLAEQGSAFLRKALEAAKAAREEKTIFLAIANSGDASLYTLALSAQDDPDGDVRQAAIQAMRLMDGAQIEARIASLLDRQDPNDVAAALHALGRRTIAAATTVTAVEDLAKSHAIPEVRRQAVLALVGWSSQWPDVARTVVAVHESDVDERVRSAAVLPARG